jgi:hypothetical protein
MLHKAQWAIYAQLELIPSAIAEQQRQDSNSVLLLQSIKQALGRNVYAPLINLFSRELYPDQQLEYLEGCLALGLSQPNQANEPVTRYGFQKLFLAVMLA